MSSPHERAAKVSEKVRAMRPNISPHVALQTAAVLAYKIAEDAEKRAADLERRLRALELRFENERKGFFYRGVWQDGETYTEGDFVTYRGSMWACLAATLTQPGSCDAWQLCVKAGRDRR